MSRYSSDEGLRNSQPHESDDDGIRVRGYSLSSDDRSPSIHWERGNRVVARETEEVRYVERETEGIRHDRERLSMPYHRSSTHDGNRGRRFSRTSSGEWDSDSHFPEPRASQSGHAEQGPGPGRVSFSDHRESGDGAPPPSQMVLGEGIYDEPESIVPPAPRRWRPQDSESEIRGTLRYYDRDVHIDRSRQNTNSRSRSRSWSRSPSRPRYAEPIQIRNRSREYHRRLPTPRYTDFSPERREYRSRDLPQYIRPIRIHSPSRESYGRSPPNPFTNSSPDERYYRRRSRDLPQYTDWSRSRHRRRSGSGSRVIEREHDRALPYRRPTSSDPDENGVELVETFSFQYKRFEYSRRERGVKQSMLRAWHQNAMWEHGIETELLTINAAESFIAEGDKSVLTLYCKKNALDATPTPQRQVHWLHVRHTEDVMDVVKNLITSCPFLHSGYQTLALGLLDRVLPQDADISHSVNQKRQKTFVSRSDGEAYGSSFLRDSVTFISTPYLTFCERKTGTAGEDVMQTLLSSQHGYDGGEHRAKSQVLSETQKWLGKEIIHVARMRSLVIGPEVLLTWGEIPLSAICKDSILVDDSDSRPPITVRVCDFRYSTYVSSVKHDTSFAELNAQMTSLTGLDEFELHEDTAGDPKLAPESWAQLLSRASANLIDIHLRLWRKRSMFYEDYESRSPRRGALGSGAGSVASPAATSHAQRRVSTEKTEGSNYTETRQIMKNKLLDRGGHSAAVRPASTTGSRYNPPIPPPKPWNMPVINDISAISKPLNTCHLSSSDDDGESQTPAPSPSGTARWHSRSATRRSERSGSDVRNGNDPTRRSTARSQQTGERERRREHEENSPPPETQQADAQDTFKSLENQVTPFLMWRVTKGDTGGYDSKNSEGNFSTMMRLLQKVDSALKWNEKYGKVYTAVYRCSLQDLHRRHESLIDVENATDKTKTTEDDPGSGPAATNLPEAPDAPPETASKPSSNEDDTESATSSAGGGTTSLPATGQGDLYINSIEEADRLSSEIFQHSLSILGLFVPIKEVAAQAGALAVLDGYWGALDVLFRHLRFSARMHGPEREQSWRIRGSCHLRGETTETCEACYRGTEYTLVDALKHLHAEGTSPAHEIPERPDEDPCTVWLQNSKMPEGHAAFRELTYHLEVFLDDLKTTLERLKELHLFIARPGVGLDTPAEIMNGSAQRDGESNGEQNSGSNAGKSDNAPESTRKNQANQTSNTNRELQISKQKSATPALPISLLRSFENIMTLFAIQARAIVLTNRRALNESSWGKREFKARNAYVSVLKAVMECLERSKQDLLQSIAAEGGKTVRLGAVGPEYIVGMIMANVQPGVFRSGVGSCDVPRKFIGLGGELRRGTRRRVVTWTDDPDMGNKTRELSDRQKDTEMMTLDLIALYTEHARAISFSATMHPQRHAFLAIRAFEEELRAIHRIYDTQWHTVVNYGKVTRSDSFPVSDEERRTRSLLESGLVVRNMRDRRRDMEELQKMLDWMEELRQRVIESIEVLDEGHGKAIRVFTLVTLFFLPLSFVTGFFGMNTADVRDMAYTSRLYWAVAVPVTLFILGIAYLYGYKWEDLTQRITRKSWLEQGLQATIDSDGREAGGAKWLVKDIFGRRRTTMDSYGPVRSRRSWRRSRAEP